MKALFDGLHNWIARQRIFVQIAILFGASFVVIACLMAAFT